MTHRGFCLLAHRGVLVVSGEDRVGFLQGLVSNDVERVAHTRAIHAALLTAQGRFQHDMVIAGFGESLLLDVERDRAEALAKKLSIYKLRSRVAVAPDLAGREVAVAFGGDAIDALGLPPEAGAARIDGDMVVLVDPRLPALGARVIAPAGQAAPWLTARGFDVAPPEAYETLRLSLGVPDGSRDLVVDKALLLENGFDELNGVDWKKGCYMGQELTARTKYRALIRKRLLPVAIAGPLPALGTPIMLGDQEAGELRSGVEGHALALLRLDMMERSAGTGVPLTAAGATLTPSLPDWTILPRSAES